MMKKANKHDIIIKIRLYNDIKDNIEDLIEYGIEHKPSTW